MENLDAHIESILFVRGGPMSAKDIANIIGAKEEEVNEALLALEQKLSGRGIRLAKNNSKFALTTSPESSEFAKKMIENEFNSELTRASLEVLSIIAYKGPISRPEIDYIRGVNSTFTVRNLLVRGLVEREVNPRDSRSFVYMPSFEFLQYMGIRNIAELPDYKIFDEKIKEFLNAKEKEENEAKNKQTETVDSGAV